jgi:hypothetical protein
MTLPVWRRLLGIASFADRWLADQKVSEACVLRLYQWQVNESKVVSRL